MRRISITGPESTGKSMLAEQLASHYRAKFVPEIARDYLNKLGRKYNYEDIVQIAQEQLRTENIVAKKTSQYLFCDTDLLVTKVWSHYKYGKCDPWIQENVKNHRYDLYLLCDIDLPWEEDPLREHPGERKELFDLYFKALKELNVKFKVISGIGPERLRNAISAVNEAFG